MKSQSGPFEGDPSYQVWLTLDTYVKEEITMSNCFGCIKVPLVSQCLSIDHRVMTVVVQSSLRWSLTTSPDSFRGDDIRKSFKSN